MRVLRVLLDANILVSGFPASAGTLAEIIARWRGGQFQLVVSEPLLAEVARAWSKPYWQARFTHGEAIRAIAALRQEADLCVIDEVVQGIATHPEDDLVLAAAISGDADVLVTGDKALQAVGQYRTTTILSPLDFLTLLIAPVPGESSTT